MEKIAITKIQNNNITAAIDSAIELIGGIERFISLGDKVLIKPNLTTDKSHEFGVTHPLVWLHPGYGLRSLRHPTRFRVWLPVMTPTR